MSTTRTEDAMRWGRPPLSLRDEVQAVMLLGASVDVVLGVLRTRIEALPAGVSDDLYTRTAEEYKADVLALFEEESRCPVCQGTTEHVLGCPEMDKPR